MIRMLREELHFKYQEQMGDAFKLSFAALIWSQVKLQTARSIVVCFLKGTEWAHGVFHHLYLAFYLVNTGIFPPHENKNRISSVTNLSPGSLDSLTQTTISIAIAFAWSASHWSLLAGKTSDIFKTASY